MGIIGNQENSIWDSHLPAWPRSRGKWRIVSSVGKGVKNYSSPPKGNINCYKCPGMQLDILRSLRNKYSSVTPILYPRKPSQMYINKYLCRRIFSSALSTKLRHWEAITASSEKRLAEENGSVENFSHWRLPGGGHQNTFLS